MKKEKATPFNKFDKACAEVLDWLPKSNVSGNSDMIFEPEGVEFLIASNPMTKAEERRMSRIIQASKAKML